MIDLIRAHAQAAIRHAILAKLEGFLVNTMAHFCMGSISLLNISLDSRVSSSCRQQVAMLSLNFDGNLFYFSSAMRRVWTKVPA